ncbi:conserved protein of unknown function [Tenacibaculum sp. 190130A14a]|uniref:DUF4868 domain-containing protein n=1 Tax=Tenacibaculum polynesiense TaxID=3137857 RepID=A0ABP1F378_9FLAO
MLFSESVIEENPEGYLTNVFSIKSDLGLSYFVFINYNADRSANSKYTTLEESNPELYSELKEGEFVTKFTNKLKEFYIEGLFQYYQSINFDEVEINRFIKEFNSFKNEIMSNQFKGDITFSQTYIDVVISEVNILISRISEMNAASEKDITSEKDTILIKSTKSANNSFFTLNDGIKISFVDLRNSLITRGCLEKSIKAVTLENVFDDYHDGKQKQINWIGSKNKLGLFIKLLKDKKIITDGQPFLIAKKTFLIKDEKITTLTPPKKEDSKNYYNSFEKMLDNHTTST